MPSFDRNGTLRNAEKLLRQGKLEAAIAEYLRVLADQPTDWSTANTLGDLYARAGQVDKAIERFIEIADTLSEEGQRVKAAAVYKKILKLKPDHEHALMQAADLVAAQGLFADARGYLNTSSRSGAPPAISAAPRRPASSWAASTLPTSPARIEGAKARLDVNDVAGAVRDICAIASELSEAARYPEAIDALKQAAALQPDDETVRGQLFEIYASADDFEHASECATTAAQFKQLAESLALRERQDQAIEMQRRAVLLDPADTDLRKALAQTLLERGDLQGAAEYLTAEIAGSDPALLMTLAEIQFRGGKTEEGMAVLRRLVNEDPARRDEIVALASKVAASSPEAGFLMVEIAAEVSVAGAEWESAAAAIEAYIAQVPNYIPALMRLVEICIDGGLEPAMYNAQAQLADAYLAAGAVADARFIAEDLVAREPWERSHIERFRRTLELLGEADPDGIIAERLSGQTPFTSTDLMAEDAAAASAAQEQARLQAEADAELMARTLAMLAEVEGDDDHEPAETRSTTSRAAAGCSSRAQAGGAVDPLRAQLERHRFSRASLASSRPRRLRLRRRARRKSRLRGKSKAHANQQSVEVDLSVELAGMKPQRGRSCLIRPRPSRSQRLRSLRATTSTASLPRCARRRRAVRPARAPKSSSNAAWRSGETAKSTRASRPSRSPRVHRGTASWPRRSLPASIVSAIS